MSSSGAPIISIRQVVKAYKTPAGDFLALKGGDEEINSGEFVGIWGKSGAGKSTLVNMISGVDHLTSGEVWVDGVGVHKLNESQAARWRGTSASARSKSAMASERSLRTEAAIISKGGKVIFFSSLISDLTSLPIKSYTLITTFSALGKAYAIIVEGLKGLG